MSLSAIASFHPAQSLYRSEAANQVDPVQKAFTNASERLQKARDVTTAQISAYGQVKSDFARVEDGGKALAATKATTSAEEMKKNLQSVVNAFNDARSAASRTEAGKSAVAARDLQRSVSTDSVRADMKTLGITRNQNGSLKLDSKALETALQTNPDAVRGAASRVGGALQQTAKSALADNGSIGTALSALNARDQGIAARQAAQQKMANVSQQTVEQTTTRLNGALSAIGSYNRVFSL